MFPYRNNQIINNQELMNNEQTKEALEGVAKAAQEEREDELFYDYLISVAPTKEEKDIIASIRDDERRHNMIFRQIYRDFTDSEVPAGKEEIFEKPKSYLDDIKRALFGELKAIDKYREIRKGITTEVYKDVLFDIITDEIKHSFKYNYLLTLNSGISTEGMNRNTRQDKLNQDKSTFTPDDWVRYIASLVDRALVELEEGINHKYLMQRFILSGVLVGFGKSPQEAFEQVEEWERTGECKLLVMSKMNRGYYW